jgi:hypothetical protein
MFQDGNYFLPLCRLVLRILAILSELQWTGASGKAA